MSAEVKAMVLKWSGSWSTSMASRTLDTFTDELSVYPLEAVQKALDRARKDWEQAKHPHLQFVLDRIEDRPATVLQVSGWEFTKGGVHWFGPAWNDLAEVQSHHAANLKTADYIAAHLRFEFTESTLEFFRILGVEAPQRPAPKQGVFS